MNQTEFSFHIKTWKAGILKHIRAVTFVKLEYQSHARVCELLRSPRICAARSCVRGGWRIFKSRIPSQSEFGAYLRLLTSKGIKVCRWAYGELGFQGDFKTFLNSFSTALHFALFFCIRLWKLKLQVSKYRKKATGYMPFGPAICIQRFTVR